MDLKRNMIGSRERSNTTDSRPLFEKYQFLSPGMPPISYTLHSFKDGAVYLGI
jgi:hypothetical protein